MDLSGIPAVDGHAHPLLRREVADALPYPSFFTEGGAGCAEAAATSLFYRRSLRDLAALLGCEADAARVREAADAKRLIDAAGLSCALLDDGYPREGAMSLDDMSVYVPVRRVLRLESVAEDLIAVSSDFSDFAGRLHRALEDPDVVAFKSVAAYRCGLRLVPSMAGALRFTDLWEGVQQGRTRLTDRAFIEFVLHIALEVADRRGLPVQFHCGFGDADLALADADPVHLKHVVEAFPTVPIVLLHNYPFTRGAGWMASVYPSVHVDFGLAVPFLSTHGMRQAVSEVFHLAPTSKILYSSDASRIPELFYLGSLHARRVLARVLEDAVADGDLTPKDAEQIAQDVLASTARRLYRL